MTSLTELETVELKRHEAVIAGGLETYFRVGFAFIEIRDRRLYRAKARTFDEYCRSRFGMSKGKVNDLIAATKVVENTTEQNGGIPPKCSVEALKKLGALDPDDQREAMNRAQELAGGETPTSKHTKQAAAEIKNPLGVHFSSATPEHYTPKEVLDPIVEFAGKIDLDPCSNPEKTVPATRHFTEEQDGLSRPWKAKFAFINPPYGDEISTWTKRALEERRKGNMKRAILLVPARTDTAWFQELTRGNPVCFWRGRITFVGNKSGAPFPSALVYLEDHDYSNEHGWDEFEFFEEYGLVCRMGAL